jgi:hypothetical protein
MQAAARAAVDAKAKPPGSLGLLEEWGVRLCELQGTLAPAVDGMCLLLFAADHGITRDTPGVSAYPRQVRRAARPEGGGRARGRSAAGTSRRPAQTCAAQPPPSADAPRAPPAPSAPARPIPAR